MNIEGGGLYFESTLDNEELNSAINETMRRIQGLTDATVAGGSEMDDAFRKTADDISRAFQDIDQMTSIHKTALRELEAEYARLGEMAGRAFDAGNDDEVRAITEKQNALKGEITVRKQLMTEIEQQADALAEAERKMEADKKKVEENTNAHVSFRSRIKELKEEMMLLVDQGIDEQSEAYKRLSAELGRLTDIQGDVAQQGRILANDEAQFQGIITGLSGLAGGFSAATGAISLFAGKNEDLQKIMVKVQSVMAITMGMQQLAQTLNKDSAFQQVTLNKLKGWWNGLKAKAIVAETAETIATTANTAAQTANATATGTATTSQAANTIVTGAQATVATAGTVANIGLAGAFRMVGLAIKSIPVFGWILTGISALIGLVAYFTKESRKAAKAQKEFNEAIVEGSYKAIGGVKNLSSQWTALGDNLDAKKKFIEENKKAFDELGVSIRDVADAEKVLANGAQAFIDAQIAKAKAAAVLAISEKWVKQSVEADLELEQAKKKPKVTRTVTGGRFGGGLSSEIDNPAIQKAIDKRAEANTKLQGSYADAAKYTAIGLEKMKEAGVDGQDKITKGTVAWYEKQISDKQAHLKTLSVFDEAEIKATQKQITDFQKIIDDATGRKTMGGSSSANKDPFLEKLEKQKKEYQRFIKWINSGDDVLSKTATTEFDGLLKQGATYIDYLKKQREIILSVDVASRSKAQNQQLRTLNDQIAEETKKTVLESFNTELSEQLNNAKSIMEMLNIIEQRRKQLANDGTELDNAKKTTLNEAGNDVAKQANEEYQKASQEYLEYLNSKIDADTRYFNEKQRLELAISQATSDEAKKILQQQLNTLDISYNTQSLIDYDALVDEYKNYEQRIETISKEYDEKIALATKKGNLDLVVELQKAKENALSKEAVDNLETSGTYTQLFGNLDKLSAQKMIELRNKLEEEWSKLNLSPEQLEVLRDKLDEVTNRIEQKSPFAALADALKRYKAASDKKIKKDALKDMFSSASSAIGGVKQGFDSVVGGLKELGVAGDEETQRLLGGFSQILGGVDDLAAGIATGNPLQIIQGSISILTSAMDIFDSGARRRDERLRKEMEYYNALVDVYDTLISKQKELTASMSGNDVSMAYKKGMEMLDAQQRAAKSSLEVWFSRGASWNSHSNKYKYDRNQASFLDRDQLFNMSPEQWNKWMVEHAEQWARLPQEVRNYADAVMNAGANMDELKNTMQEAIAGFSLDESRSQLAELVKATSLAFEDISTSFAKNMEDAIMRITQGKFDERLKQWYANVVEAMKDGVLTEAEKTALQNEYIKIVTDADNEYEAAKKAAGITDLQDKANTSLTGSVKGVTEETASLVAGQMNAIRINQAESTQIIRQQLFHLANIDRNTGAIDNNTRFIKNIYDKMTSSGDSMRSQGLL